MTTYIAAYDTEMIPGPGDRTSCLDACKRIVEVHEHYEMPATFFIVGRTLEAHPEAYRELLDRPLFEIASHTWSHRMIKDHPICGKAVTGDDLREEIIRGKQAIERVFPDREVVGLRPGCSFVDGLRNAPEALALVNEAGYRYVSSLAWDVEYTIPAPIRNATDYAADGYPDLVELPAHGWHDNVLKTMSGPGFRDRPWRVLGFPPRYPGAIPPGPITGPEQEFHYNCRFFIDEARREHTDYVNLIWHPWSLATFDPPMKMLEMTFEYVRSLDMPVATFEQFVRQHATATRSTDAVEA